MLNADPGMQVARAEVEPPFAYCPKVFRREPGLEFSGEEVIFTRFAEANVFPTAHGNPGGVASSFTGAAATDGHVPPKTTGNVLMVFSGRFRDSSLLDRHGVGRRCGQEFSSPSPGMNTGTRRGRERERDGITYLCINVCMCLCVCLCLCVRA